MTTDPDDACDLRAEREFAEYKKDEAEQAKTATGLTTFSDPQILREWVRDVATRSTFVSNFPTAVLAAIVARLEALENRPLPLPSSPDPDQIAQLKEALTVGDALARPPQVNPELLKVLQANSDMLIEHSAIEAKSQKELDEASAEIARLKEDLRLKDISLKDLSQEVDNYKRALKAESSIWRRAQEMFKGKHWARLGENYLTIALDRIEALEKGLVDELERANAHYKAHRETQAAYDKCEEERDAALSEVKRLEIARTELQSANKELSSINLALGCPSAPLPEVCRSLKEVAENALARADKMTWLLRDWESWYATQSTAASPIVRTSKALDEYKKRKS